MLKLICNKTMHKAETTLWKFVKFKLPSAAAAAVAHAKLQIDLLPSKFPLALWK